MYPLFVSCAYTDMNPSFGDIRSALHGPLTQQSWWSLVERLIHWPEPERSQVLHPYLITTQRQRTDFLWTFPPSIVEQTCALLLANQPQRAQQLWTPYVPWCNHLVIMWTKRTYRDTKTLRMLHQLLDLTIERPLRGLAIRYPIIQETLATSHIGEHPALEQLTHFHWHGGQAIHERRDSVDVLSGLLTHLPTTIQTLELRHATLSDQSLDMVLNRHHVHHLDLRGNPLSEPRHRDLEQAPMPQLRHLSIDSPCASWQHHHSAQPYLSHVQSHDRTIWGHGQPFQPRHTVHVTMALRGQPSPTTMSFSEEVVTIGRLPQNHVTIPLGNVSKRHLRIYNLCDGLWAKDWSSTGGTYLNGRQMVGYCKVLPIDVIQIGDTIIELEQAQPTTH